MSFIITPSIVPPFTAGGVAYGTGTVAKVSAAGTVGYVLTSNGTAAPSFQVLSGVSTVDVFYYSNL